MKRRDADVDRLLRSAAKAPENAAPEAPFGFETRVLAAWRSRHESGNDVADLTRFLRRTGVIAFAVLTIASAAAYKQFADDATLSTPQTNDYAIADSAIQTEFSQ
jgi:hypothetical protein